MKFILFGRSRSGTTITYNILRSHPEISILNQSGSFVDTGFIGGDKIGTPSLDVFKQLVTDKEFQFIHIYRDGRDSVSSGMGKAKVWKEYRAWKDLDPKINSKDWADAIWRWEEAKEFVPLDRRLDIRFEDYLDQPTKNARLIADFLHVDRGMLISSEKEKITINNAHRGRYKQHTFDWQKDFHSDAIKALKLLNYI